MFRRASPSTKKQEDVKKKTTARKMTSPSKATTSKAVSTTIYVIYNDCEEFPLERSVLWQDVLPELQNYGFHSNFDVQWVDVGLEFSKLTSFTAEKVLRRWENDETSWIVCLVGDKYGAPTPPSTIRKQEFESIRSAFFENNGDVRIIDQSYAIDRSYQSDEYRLQPSILNDPKLRAKLTKAVQKGAQAAFDEGSINQIHEERQRRFFISPIHVVAQRIIQSPTNSRCTFLLRKFDGVTIEAATTNANFLEKTPDSSRKVEDLKNEISAKMDEKATFAHVLTPENGDIAYFFASKDGEKYRDKLTRQVTERLKSQFSLMHRDVRPDPPASLIDLADEENNSHLAHLKHQLSIPHYSRTDIDKKADEILSSKKGGSVYLIQGPDASGKTQVLCRMFEKAPADAHKIIRFTNLTYASTFAHEFWRLICFSVCSAAKFDPQIVLQHFKLEKIIEIFETYIEKLEKPLYLFIDDIHLLKHGNFLSNCEKRVKSAPQKLIVFVTASNVSPVQSLFTITQTFNVTTPTEDDVIEMMKKVVAAEGRRLSNEQWGAVRQQIVGSNENILFAKSLIHEMLQQGSLNAKGGFEGRLERLEVEFGTAAVQAVCKFLSVASHGLTRLELHDVLSSQRDLLSQIGTTVSFPPLLLDEILEAFGPILHTVFIDQRNVISISHFSLLNIVRHRYLSSTADLKATHVALSDLFSEHGVTSEELSPRSSFTYTNFPQALKKENGSTNVRKLRLLWFHLLHTGNMDALKELTLCHFDYIDLIVRYFGVMHLLTLYEECAMQVLHHDLQALCEQVLLPSLSTIVRDNEQLAAEVIGRLRFTRADNSHFLNTMVEQAMGWVDLYNRQPLLVPLTCWISPPTMKMCRSFLLKEWKAGQTVLAPTQNHQHVLISGNQSAPGFIYMYHIASQYLIATFKGHSAAVTSICASNNGMFFVSTSVDLTVKIWSFVTGECLKTLKPHSQKVLGAILSSDDSFMITASADSSAKMINVESGDVIRSFSDHTGSVVSLQLTSNDQFLITGSGDFVVQMWDVTNGNCISRMGGLMAPVSCLAITTNDAFVVVACEDETLKVFSTVSGQELHELMGHEGKVNALACAQDDCQLFAATKSKIFCYDIHNGQMIDVLDCAQPFPVFSLKISSDNYFLVSGCGPKVHIWNIQKRNHDAHDVTVDKEGFLTAIAMSYDEKVSACGTYNGIVALWDLDICQCISTVVQAKGIPVTCITFTVDNAFLISGNSVGSILLLDAANGNVIRDINFHTTEIVSICSLYTGKVLSCDKDGKFIQWDTFLEDDIPEMVVQGVKPPVFVPPSGRILIGHCPANVKEMKIWTLPEEAAPVQKNKLSHNDEITCFATAPKGGSLVATGSLDMSLKLWNIESGFLTQVLVGHDDVVTCCDLADDERIVVSGSRDRKVIIWNVATGDVVCNIFASASVTSVALTRDGTVAFSSTEEGWLEAWTTDKGRRLSSFNAHRPIRKVITSLEANRLLVHLTGCAQLPILCLHNTPASAHAATRRRSARTHSVSSIGNEIVTASDAKKETTSASSNTLQTGNGQAAAGSGRPSQPRPTFDKLERSKSRTSLIEKDRPTTLTQAVTPVQKSSMCSIL